MGRGYVNDNLLGSIANAAVKNAHDVYLSYKYAGIFSQINYNWRNKYVINLSARRDGIFKIWTGEPVWKFLER